MNCHINCYCLSRKAFHALWVVKDCMPLSHFLTKMTPSRVQVSEILRSRFRVRASQAIVARVFVRSSFMKTWVPFNFRADRITDVLVLWVVKRTMMSRGVERSSALLPTKASVVERFNRTLKARMWRYFTEKQSDRYVDVPQDMVRAYNRFHLATGIMAPSEVNTTNQEDG